MTFDLDCSTINTSKSKQDLQYILSLLAQYEQTETANITQQQPSQTSVRELDFKSVLISGSEKTLEYQANLLKDMLHISFYNSAYAQNVIILDSINPQTYWYKDFPDNASSISVYTSINGGISALQNLYLKQDRITTVIINGLNNYVKANPTLFEFVIATLTKLDHVNLWCLTSEKDLVPQNLIEYFFSKILFHCTKPNICNAMVGDFITPAELVGSEFLLSDNFGNKAIFSEDLPNEQIPEQGIG